MTVLWVLKANGPTRGNVWAVQIVQPIPPRERRLSASFSQKRLNDD